MPAVLEVDAYTLACAAMIGLTVSGGGRTLTVKVEGTAALPQLSVAVQETSVLPNIKDEPDTGEQETAIRLP